MLDLLANGWTLAEVLENYPQLSREALCALFAFAAECARDEQVYSVRRLASMKLLADENVPLRTVMALRRSGEDVLAVAEVSPGAGDEDVLRLGRTQGRVIVTFDRDYGELVFRQRLMPPARCSVSALRPGFAGRAGCASDRVKCERSTVGRMVHDG